MGREKKRRGRRIINKNRKNTKQKKKKKKKHIRTSKKHQATNYTTRAHDESIDLFSAEQTARAALGHWTCPPALATCQNP